MGMEWCCSSELHRTFRITGRGVDLSGKGKLHKNVPEAKAISPQFTRDKVIICLKSLGSDQKPGDLIQNKVKWE